jgi:hypothetical protein
MSAGCKRRDARDSGVSAPEQRARSPDLAAASLADALGRVWLRADTVLRELPDAELQAGLRRLEAAVAAEDPAHPTGPIFGRLPLVVFGK